MSISSNYDFITIYFITGNTSSDASTKLPPLFYIIHVVIVFDNLIITFALLAGPGFTFNFFITSIALE